MVVTKPTGSVSSPVMVTLIHDVCTAASPPFSTNAIGRVTNLNADKLDGLDSSALVRRSRPFGLWSAPVPEIAVVVDGAATVTQLEVPVGAECGPNTRHQYLVEHQSTYAADNARYLAAVLVCLTKDSELVTNPNRGGTCPPPPAAADG